MAATEGEDKVLATAQRIVKSLGKTSDAEDMLLILSAFDNRLSGLSSFVSDEGGAEETSSLDPRFESAERVILEKADSRPVSDEYLAAIDEIIRFAAEWSLECGDDRGSEATERADDALQLSMAKLEDEFRYLLVRNNIPVEPDRLHHPRFSCSRISAEGSEYFTDESNESPKQVGGCSRFSHRGGVSSGWDEISFDLIHPDAVTELNEIADRMIRAGYEKECCHIYCSLRRDALEEDMVILGVEKLSIEEVQRIEWDSLDDKMRKWAQAVRIVVRGLLMGEKRLCEMIFYGSDLIKEACFLETTKGCVMQMLNFGEAVAIGKRSAEKMSSILYMYDELSLAMPDIQILYGGNDVSSMVYNEAKAVLDGLAEAAIGALVEFENAVQGEASKKLVHDGDVHPFSSYVMNTLKVLVYSRNTLNSLLEKATANSRIAESSDGSDSESRTPIARKLLALITSLESNIQEKAKLYEDPSMQCIFLMNNTFYIVENVKDTELQNLLGVEWIKKRRGVIRQYAKKYLRGAWGQPLSYLKDEGIGGSPSNSKLALKERFKNFNACFENIHRIQTAWRIRDTRLGDDLRISIAQKVIPAYRSFLGRFGSLMESSRHSGRYIKYNPEELESFLLDLFAGKPLVLNHIRRKNG